MTKKSSLPPGSRGKGGQRNEAEVKPASQGYFSPESIREIVESVVIAFVLAFLFRTFEAEAFVIPTGSMAPTLMGRHKDVVCDQCGFEFQVSASNEVKPDTNEPTGEHVLYGTCPNCRHTMYLGPNDPSGRDEPSYKGDRILVGKFPYELGDPERWNVAVFHYPENAKVNFIKRLVGLPNETIRIAHGDIFVKHQGEQDFTIARKPPPKILAMLQAVFDNDDLTKPIRDGVWQPRWVPQPSTEGDPKGGWATGKDLMVFRTDGSSKHDVWLKYRNLIPSDNDWREYLATASGQGPTEPQLITDYTAYDTEISQGPGPGYAPVNWVGDLSIACELQVERAGGEAVLELVKGGRRFQCRIDLTSGQATLTISGLPDFHPAASTRVRGPGTYRLRLANVDHQLTLWVNGSVATFQSATTKNDDNPTAYESLDDDQPQPADLTPVRIGARDAAIQVRHLRIDRDLYYIAVKGFGSSDGTLSEFLTPTSRGIPRVWWEDFPDNPYAALSHPDRWAPYRSLRVVEFPLKADQFFMLGDNSAQSKDGRLWDPNEYFVQRDLLIGKALFIYWPHALKYVPYTSIPVYVFPNFKRMGLVR